MKKHQTFKETLGTFFLDILQRFVFAKAASASGAEEKGVDRDVLESLLSFVVTKGRMHVKRTNSIFTGSNDQSQWDANT